MDAQAKMIDQESVMEGYYKVHAQIYNATRWSFLFGRKCLVKALAMGKAPKRILEIGCGTGANLLALSKQFPDSEIIGLDASPSMLEVAKKVVIEKCDNVKLVHAVYDHSIRSTHGEFDVILASYCLSMINPGWDSVIKHASKDLSKNGRFALVDFHDSPITPFKKWMEINHVRMEGHLPPALHAYFTPSREEIKSAYCGAWQYLLFIGSPKRHLSD